MKNICFYIDFSAKLNMRYLVNQRLIEIIHYSEKKLMFLIRGNHKEAFAGFKTFLEKNLEKYDDVIYFSEMIKLYIAIVELMMDFTFPSEDLVELLEKFYLDFNAQTQYFIAVLLYRYYQIYEEDKDKVTFYFEQLMKLDPENIEFILTYKKSTMPALEFYHELIKMDVCDLLIQEQILVQAFIVNCLIELNQYTLAKREVNRWIELVEGKQEQVMDYLLYQAYVKKAVILYYLEEYDDALIYFKHVYHYKPDLLQLDFILFMESYVRSKQSKDLCNYLDMNNYNQLKIPKVKRIYRYYQQKYTLSYSYKELELFALEELHPIIPIHSIYHDLIQRDMMEYCVSTTDYKLFFLFLKQPKRKKK